jgi:N-acetylmuramoyl-L-alanine amidase
MGLHRAEDNLEVAKRENAAILMEDDYLRRYDGYDPNSPEGHIILSMYQNAHLEQSILFADFVEKQFMHGLDRKSRGVKQAGFVVLRNTTMPSVLIETGFLSHDADEAFLGDKSNHAGMAQSIFRAFSDYKAHMEGFIPEADEPVVEIPVPEEKKPAPQAGGVTYYVQLAASRTPLTDKVATWKIPQTLETKKENGYYKYLAGPFAEAGQATEFQKEMRAGSFRDAFVVAYRDNQRITLAEAAATSR